MADISGGGVTDAAVYDRLAAMESKVPVINGLTTAATRLTTLEAKDRFLTGTYTVDTLPAASSYPFMYAPVTDLGGGADFVVSDGSYWKHIRRGTVVNVNANTGVNIVPLKTATIYSINGTVNTNMIMSVDHTKLYPGYLLSIKRQSALSTVLGAVGSLGIKTTAPGATNLALTDTRNELIWDGTQFVQI